MPRRACSTFLLALFIAGCGSTRSTPAGPDAGWKPDQSADVAPAKGHARIWAESCQRCHNARPASFYTYRQWQVAMHHMRVRGALTAEESRSVMEFFKAAKRAPMEEGS
jgi:hypothetical protein